MARLALTVMFLTWWVAGVSFEECDIDNSRLLTPMELRDCFDGTYGVGVMNVDRIVPLFDRDNDGGISIVEYRLVLENIRDTTLEGEVLNDGELGDASFDEVDVEYRDGTVKTMKRDEFLEMHQAQMDEQGSAAAGYGGQQEFAEVHDEDIDSLMLKNPELGRFIQLAKWAQLVMEKLYNGMEGNRGKDAHFPPGSSIYELRSLPPGGSEQRGQETSEAEAAPAVTGVFDIYFELSILSSSSSSSGGEEGPDKKTKKKTKNKGKEYEKDRSSSRQAPKPAEAPMARDIRKYEFHVIGDPEVYRLPHAVVAECWELGDDGARIDVLSVPPPRLYKSAFNGGNGGDDDEGWLLVARMHRLWKMMSRQQRAVTGLGVGFAGLIVLYCIVLPCVNFLVVMQLGKDDDEEED
jgi:hypothetical protein